MNRIQWRIHYLLAVFGLTLQMLYAIYLILAMTIAERIKRAADTWQTFFFKSAEESSPR